MRSRIPVVGVGAGPHAKVLADALREDEQHEVVGLINLRPEFSIEALLGIPVLGTFEDLPRLVRGGLRHVFIGLGGVGDNGPRRDLFRRILDLGLEPVNVIHPTAYVAPSAALGRGSVVLARAVINVEARVGDNVIVNTGSIIEHDCVIGDHCHVAPGAILGGGVVVGDCSHIGMGAVIRQRIVVERNALVAAGAVVVDDVSENVIVEGVPARRLRERTPG